jgi:hypothetical protein
MLTASSERFNCREMKITITDRRKIFAIQKEFSTLFPFLKLEFFAKAGKPGGSASPKPVKESSKTLGECRTIHNNGHITITPGMTVKNLEENFRDVYGLTVQILRKSGKAWLGTTVTDGWSLKEQNEQGAALSNNISQNNHLDRKSKRTSDTSKAKKYFIN